MNPNLEQFKKILQIQEERNLYHQKQYETLKNENEKLSIPIQKLTQTLESEQKELQILDDKIKEKLEKIESVENEDTPWIDEIQDNILNLQAQIKQTKKTLLTHEKKITLELSQFEHRKKEKLLQYKNEISEIDKIILEYQTQQNTLDTNLKNINTKYNLEIKSFEDEIENIKYNQKETFIQRFQKRNQNFHNLIKFKDLEKKNLQDIQNQEELNRKLQNDRKLLIDNQEKKYQDVLTQNNLELQKLKTNNSNLEHIDTQLKIHQDKLNLIKTQQEKALNLLDFKINQNLEKIKILQLEKNQIHDNHKNQNLKNHNYLEDIKIWKSKISKLQNQKKFEQLKLETEIENLKTNILDLQRKKQTLQFEIPKLDQENYQNFDLKKSEIYLRQNISEMNQEIHFYQKEIENKKLENLEIIDNWRNEIKDLEEEKHSLHKKFQIHQEEINFLQTQKEISEKTLKMNYDSQKEYHNQLILKELSIMLNIHNI